MCERLHKHTQRTQAEQCAAPGFLKRRVVPEAERATTEPEKLAEQKVNRENSARRFREECNRFVFCLDLIFLSGFMASHHRATGAGVSDCDSASW